MSDPIYRPRRDWSTAWLYLKFSLLTTAFVLLVIWLTGCASPGKVGFHQLRQQNAVEKRTLKAVGVHADNIGRHADRALKLSDDLAHTTLTPPQAKKLSEITLELKQVEAERDGLLRELLEAKTINLQRDATIAQTQAEVKESAWQKFWREVRMRALWCAIGIGIGLFLYGILHGALLAARAYIGVQVPGAAVAIHEVESLVEKR